MPVGLGRREGAALGQVPAGRAIRSVVRVNGKHYPEAAAPMEEQ